MDQLDFQCPICSIKYSQSNPPRLLTMCGHTFCHKCIKSLITKKKDGKYKIKCHIDQIATQMQSPSPNYFPKNIVLLQALIKSKQKTRSAIFLQDQNNQFLSMHVPNIPQKSETETNKKQIHQNRTVLSNIQSNQTCTIHNKKLEVLCCFDLQNICTDCALFGKHKGHKFKNIQEVLKQQKVTTKQLTEMILKKKHIQNKIKNDQIQKQILQLLQNKKSILKSRIQSHFDALNKLVKACQMEAYQNLNIIIVRAQKAIYKKLVVDDILQSSYKVWEQQANTTMQSLQSDNKSQLLIDYINKSGYKQLIKNGQKIISQIENQEDMLIYQLEHQIQSMKFQSLTDKIEEVKYRLSDTYEIKFSQNQENWQFQKQNPSNESFDISILKDRNNKGQEEESLLDCQQQEDFRVKRPLKHSNSFNSISLSAKSNSSCMMNLTNNKSNFKQQSKKTSSNDRQKLSMLRKKNSSLAITQISASNANLNSTLILASNRPRTLTYSSSSVLLKSNSAIKNKHKIGRASNTNITELAQKYLKALQKVKNGLSDTLDLSGAELGDQSVVQILNNLKKFTHIKNIKLVKNRLTDSSLSSILFSFPLIQKLNLAQNKFTQSALQNILKLQNQKKLSLSCLNLAHNKIIQRKQKAKLQQLKSQNVTVSL